MTPLAPLFDYARLRAFVEANAAGYQSAHPFPHIVIDDFLSADTVAELVEAFPEIKKQESQYGDELKMEDGRYAQREKRWLSSPVAVKPVIRRLYWELNSADFLECLEILTGIDGLIPDPHMFGGGLHETRKGGYLNVHADFNKHPWFRLDRRLNLLVYLNPGWQPEYGGDLELWERDLSACVKSVSPIAGRAALFSTTRDSFHGHPHPLTCPEGMSRKSLALYYYTHGRPANEDPSEHKTLWKSAGKD
ncbi:MAG: 2OG-Fe(II) oxygenase [Gammaproteobacteria bacterium]|nr:MAG: 2OG-Fe(II) oxygenase [Gammaproteobacteria bacterium]